MIKVTDLPVASGNDPELGPSTEDFKEDYSALPLNTISKIDDLIKTMTGDDLQKTMDYLQKKYTALCDHCNDTVTMADYNKVKNSGEKY